MSWNSVRRAADLERVLGEIENMKLFLHDTWFARCVKERVGWVCECCGKQYQEGDRGLHCSHFVGRANYAVRCEPENADAHCYYCHSQFEQNPHKHTEWKRARLGPVRYDALIEMSNNIMRGKEAKQNKKEMAKHYKSEFERMQKLRAQGETGRIEFVGWQ